MLVPPEGSAALPLPAIHPFFPAVKAGAVPAGAVSCPVGEGSQWWGHHTAPSARTGPTQPALTRHPALALQKLGQAGLPDCCYPHHYFLFLLSMSLLAANSIITGRHLNSLFLFTGDRLGSPKISQPCPSFLSFRFILPITSISIPRGSLPMLFPHFQLPQYAAVHVIIYLFINCEITCIHSTLYFGYLKTA